MTRFNHFNDANNTSNRPPVRKHKKKYWNRAQHRVAASSQKQQYANEPSEPEFCKEFYPRETLKKLIEPMTQYPFDEPQTWARHYYNAMRRGDMNGDEVAEAAPKPTLSEEAGPIECYQYERDYDKYEVRCRAARAITWKLMNAISASTEHQLEIMSAKTLNLPTGYQSFKSYVNILQDFTQDPVLVYRMIAKAVAYECVGNDTVGTYAHVCFNNLKMGQEESIESFRERFEATRQQIQLLANGIEGYLPWIDLTVEPPLDLTVALFYSKLSSKYYQEKRLEGLFAIMVKKIDNLPETLDKAMYAAKVSSCLTSH